MAIWTQEQIEAVAVAVAQEIRRRELEDAAAEAAEDEAACERIIKNLDRDAMESDVWYHAILGVAVLILATVLLHKFFGGQV